MFDLPQSKSNGLYGFFIILGGVIANILAMFMKRYSFLLSLVVIFMFLLGGCTTKEDTKIQDLIDRENLISQYVQTIDISTENDKLTFSGKVNTSEKKIDGDLFLNGDFITHVNMNGNDLYVEIHSLLNFIEYKFLGPSKDDSRTLVMDTLHSIFEKTYTKLDFPIWDIFSTENNTHTGDFSPLYTLLGELKTEYTTLLSTAIKQDKQMNIFTISIPNDIVKKYTNTLSSDSKYESLLNLAYFSYTGMQIDFSVLNSYLQNNELGGNISFSEIDNQFSQKVSLYNIAENKEVFFIESIKTLDEESMPEINETDSINIDDVLNSPEFVSESFDIVDGAVINAEIEEETQVAMPTEDVLLSKATTSSIAKRISDSPDSLPSDIFSESLEPIGFTTTNIENQYTLNKNGYDYKVLYNKELFSFSLKGKTPQDLSLFAKEFIASTRSILGIEVNEKLLIDEIKSTLEDGVKKSMDGVKEYRRESSILLDNINTGIVIGINTEKDLLFIEVSLS